MTTEYAIISGVLIGAGLIGIVIAIGSLIQAACELFWPIIRRLK